MFKMQRLLDALRKRWPGLKFPCISLSSVTVALIFSIVTTLSLDVMADRYRYSVGDISQAELLKRHEVFKRNYDAHEVTAGIDGLPADLEVKILLVTWCHDSEREVPRLLELLAASGVKEESISLIAIDISKQEPTSREKALGVKKTPTFIFFSGGTELGRIVEQPSENLVEDIKLTTS